VNRTIVAYRGSAAGRSNAKPDVKMRPTFNPEFVESTVDSDDSSSIPMVMPDGMKVARDVVDPGIPAIRPVSAVGSGKIVLTSAGQISAGQVTTLMGLKNSLQGQRRDSERALSSAIYRPSETHQVTLDLIKSKF